MHVNLTKDEVTIICVALCGYVKEVEDEAAKQSFSECMTPQREKQLAKDALRIVEMFIEDEGRHIDVVKSVMNKMCGKGIAHTE